MMPKASTYAVEAHLDDKREAMVHLNRVANWTDRREWALTEQRMTEVDPEAVPYSFIHGCDRLWPLPNNMQSNVLNGE